MNKTIKEAVLALADTNPELAAELAKETSETAARVSSNELNTVMRVVHLLKKSKVSTINWALDLMDKRTRNEVIRSLVWFEDHLVDASQQIKDTANRRGRYDQVAEVNHEQTTERTS